MKQFPDTTMILQQAIAHQPSQAILFQRLVRCSKKGVHQAHSPRIGVKTHVNYVRKASTSTTLPPQAAHQHSQGILCQNPDPRHNRSVHLGGSTRSQAKIRVHHVRKANTLTPLPPQVAHQRSQGILCQKRGHCHNRSVD